MDGAELARRREALEMNQTELGRCLGVPANTIWRWEHGFTIKHPAMLRLALERLAMLQGGTDGDGKGERAANGAD